MNLRGLALATTLTFQNCVHSRSVSSGNFLSPCSCNPATEAMAAAIDVAGAMLANNPAEDFPAEDLAMVMKRGVFQPHRVLRWRPSQRRFQAAYEAFRGSTPEEQMNMIGTWFFAYPKMLEDVCVPSFTTNASAD